MTAARSGDESARVRKRLGGIALARKEDAHWVMSRYARERFLYRLSISPYAGRFVLKGATLFSLWAADLHRPTRDLDLLGRGASDVPGLERIFREVCTIAAGNDALSFDPASVHGARIQEGDEYQGVRIKLRAQLGGARLYLQVDVGFGDAVVPAPRLAVLPTLLDDSPPPRLRVYPREAVVAEKFQILVSLGVDNSRMKDFYDLWTLASRFEFDGATLCRSIGATFKRRRTAIPETAPVALTAEFCDSETKQIQWNAFVRKEDLGTDNVGLPEVIGVLAGFLLPPAQAAARGETLVLRWLPGGHWV